MLFVAGFELENDLCRSDDINIRMQPLIRDKIFLKVLTQKINEFYSLIRQVDVFKYKEKPIKNG